MLSGLVLLYVGAVLMLNGLWLRGHIGDREILIINLLVGLLSLRVAHEWIFQAKPDLAAVRAGAYGLLFAFTYLWVAYNRWSGADGRGLGWFSLFVATTALPVALLTWLQASSLWGYWESISWAAWAVLWWLYFMLLVRGKPWQGLVGTVAMVQGLLTGWLPGFLLLQSAPTP